MANNQKVIKMKITKEESITSHMYIFSVSVDGVDFSVDGIAKQSINTDINIQKSYCISDSNCINGFTRSYAEQLCSLLNWNTEDLHTNITNIIDDTKNESTYIFNGKTFEME